MIKGIEERRVILSFDDVSLITDPASRSGSVDVGLDLLGGELLLIRIERQSQGTVLGDACAGLVLPPKGRVVFLGKEWSQLPPDIANALRGRIGRVFARGSWVGHLSLLENLLLPQLHHTRRSLTGLRDEAVTLADNFGLPGVPMGHSNDSLPVDLQRAACVRAFLGQTMLIVLEEQSQGCFKEMMPNLITAIRQARNRGAAVMWLTSDKFIWRDQSIPATRRYRLAGRQLMEVSR
jgi:phospholipid/cholesterol/gamma-HCH transport system ATP-binding protein